MAEPVVIGIDVGTSGVRVLAVGPGGEVLAQASHEHPLMTPRPGWTEQDPADWWQGAQRGLRQVLAQLAAAGTAAAQVAGVGLTGQMHGSVFLGRAGNVVRPAILWNDQRTAEECGEITARVGAGPLMRLTGNPALTGFTAPKILWLRRHEPAAYARVTRIMLPKDYVRYRLTGAVVTDVADASGTLLFDVHARTWSAEVCRALEIPLDMLPPAYEGPEVTGRVSAEAAAATGLPAGTPVVAGGGDQAAGAVGVGLVDEGMVSCSIGTSGVVFAASRTAQVHPEGRLHAFCHAVPGRWHLMGVMLSAGGSLRWLRDALYGAEAAADRAAGRDPYDRMVAEAADTPPGAAGLIFLPYLTGERTPHADPAARGAWIGLGLQHGRPHMARAVLEGISFGLLDSLELVRAMGVPVPGVRVTGGGARSRFWRELLAAVFGVPITGMAADEGPAYGAAVLAAVGAGLYPTVDAACTAMVRTAGTVPAACDRGVYPELYEAYRQAYVRLQGLFPRLVQLG